ncbi:MAG: hypothetical protein J5J06_05780 [Phycisphaerae bacterium]|nr:hypothetical protein [Phycisphaerae bacterium]
MIRSILGIGLGVASLLCPACGREAGEQKNPVPVEDTSHAAEGEAGHSHAMHGEANDHEDHPEVDLGSFMIGDMSVGFAQGHGKVEAGKESHLVVKLPYDDKGATVVRGWIGTNDPTLSYVGKGQYAAAHGDYDVHAIAPDPLPETTMWWIEIEKPDGTRTVGSVKPILD